MRLFLAGMLSLVSVSACSAPNKPEPVVPAAESRAQPASAAAGALVTLEAKSVEATQSTTTGSGAFSSDQGKVSLVLKLTGAPPGEHGVHIHAKGDCSAPDGSSAGDHWNPGMHQHGDNTDPSTTHLGDLGNLTVAADGTGTLSISNSGWSVGDGAPGDVVGKAIVVHAKVDDLATQANPDAGVTPGNSGKRIACGVITRE